MTVKFPQSLLCVCVCVQALTAVSQEGDVQIVANAHQPQQVGQYHKRQSIVAQQCHED